MEHVDVVRYDPREGVVQRVATVFLEGETLQVKPTEDQRDYAGLLHALLRKMPGSAADRLIGLSSGLQSPFLAATTMHSNEFCSFGFGETVATRATRW